jgi:hypothetical protein
MPDDCIVPSWSGTISLEMSDLDMWSKPACNKIELPIGYSSWYPFTNTTKRLHGRYILVPITTYFDRILWYYILVGLVKGYQLEKPIGNPILWKAVIDHISR